MFAVNLAAPHWLTMGFLPHFPDEGGVVINVTSIAASTARCRPGIRAVSATPPTERPRPD